MQQTVEKRSVRLVPFFATIYFVQGIAEPTGGIAQIPILFFLKENLGLGVAETAALMALVPITWIIKPVYGVISDIFPLFGYRRKSYLLLATGIATLGWLSLGLLRHYPYEVALGILMLISLGLAISDVLCDAVMVETGTPLALRLPPKK